MGASGVGATGKITVQGELAVGNATVQFSATRVPCKQVWVGAPTANHTVGAANDGRILVGKNSGGNASGGRPVEVDDYKGFLILVDDLSELYATGFNAGDVLEYQVIA